MGTTINIDELENLYNSINAYFELRTNYPGWAKGLYPIRETAVNGIRNYCLFVLKISTFASKKLNIYSIKGQLVLENDFLMIFRKALALFCGGVSS